MFDPGRFDIEARSAAVLERIYHKGHAHAWDGKAVLDELIEKHGPPNLPPDKRAAVGRLFAVIMWGELAAWRVSVQLADALEPLEAKMAATSQGFDEARHFYVMHDYLEQLDAMPERLDRATEMLLGEVMGTRHLAHKLLGMQLMIEPVALSIFHVVKELRIEPVLSDLMPYYERDEARHVALGVKYLPTLVRAMSYRERLSLWLFQFRILSYELVSNHGLMRDLEVLGIDPRLMADIGRTKQIKVLEQTMKSVGMYSNVPTWLLDRYATILLEISYRSTSETLRDHIERVVRTITHGSAHYEQTPVMPDIPMTQTPAITPSATL
jgi:hypothetical protein